jgi:hypothetical protein
MSLTEVGAALLGFLGWLFRTRDRKALTPVVTTVGAP